VRRRNAAASLVALATLAGLAGLLGTRDAHGTTAVNLVATEFAYIPKDPAVPHGVVTFVVKNDGAIEHNFVLEDRRKKKATEIPIIEPGDTLRVEVALQPGVYSLYCSLPGHKEAGMITSLTVK
jgi:plastocyanin